MPSKHALLGPSSAHRWMLCTPSAKWEATLPDTESEAAQEGTLAHSICEVKLKAARGKAQGKRGPLKGITKLRADPLYTESMDKYTDQYVELVMRDYEAYMLAGYNPELFIEVQLDLSKWAPDSFGTSDAVIVTDDRIHVYDFKYGKGVPVSADHNPQMMMYALGAYEKFSMLEEFKLAMMTIIQPRIDNFSEWSCTVPELLQWGEQSLIPAAQKAFAGEGQFTPGEKQCRFCRGRYRCRFNAAYQLQFLKEWKTDRNGPELSPLEIGGILEQVAAIKSWAEGMKETAQKRAMDGERIPGWKLVKGRAVRKITNPYDAIQKLLETGADPKTVYELKGISELEKSFTKDGLKSVLGDLIQLTTPKPALARESDLREEYDPINPDDYFKEEND